MNKNNEIEEQIQLVDEIEALVSNVLDKEKCKKKDVDIRFNGTETRVLIKKRILGTVIVANGKPTFQYTID